MAALHGSPAFSIAELRRQTPAVRAEADAMLVAAAGVTAKPASRLGACGRPGTGPRAITAPGVVVVAADTATLTAGRFAAPATTIGTLAPGKPLRLDLPRTGLAAPWRVSTDPAVPFRLCTAAK
jgi:hypothetical protein